MHLGKSYRVSEFIVWTRRQIYLLIAVGAVPVVLYQVLGLRWISLPLTVVALLGTATSFIVGFKNVQTYNRTVEAQQLWTSILNASRFWGASVSGYVADPVDTRKLVARHFAWLCCLRYQLRARKPWETQEKATHAEYRSRYRILEHEVALTQELRKHLSPGELVQVLESENPAMEVLWMQGRALKHLLEEERFALTAYIELNKVLKEFIEYQGRVERIKNFPYPRQYAVINTIFVWAFCALLPFGLLKEFDKLNDGITGLMQGAMVWLVVPFSATISWMYIALEQVGESTENPFEGGANDVPITYVARLIERDLAMLIGETRRPPLPEPVNDILS